LAGKLKKRIFRYLRDKFKTHTVIEIPDSLINLLPAYLKLEELIPGKGDALVSAESSVMPWSSSHYNFPANHVSIMWNREMIQKTIEVLKSI